MLANMGSSLIEHKSINTTLAKAKALKLFIEPIITKSKIDSTHNRRIVFKYLRNKYAVTELFRDVAVKIGDRPGGYTRIIKLGNRSGDNADMAMIELVDYNELYSQSKPESRRRRRRKKKSTEKIPSEIANASDENRAEEAPVKEVPKEEAPAEEAPAEEAPVKEVPKEEAPAENSDTSEDLNDEDGKQKKEN